MHTLNHYASHAVLPRLLESERWDDTVMHNDSMHVSIVRLVTTLLFFFIFGHIFTWMLVLKAKMACTKRWYGSMIYTNLATVS